MGDWLRSWCSRIHAWARTASVDREFTAELDSHLEMIVDEHLARGMTRADARRTALVRLGGLTQLRETHRDQQGLPVVERIAQDARFAVRRFIKAPAFSLFVVMTLALGIGATAAVFGLADAVLLKPFPYPDPDRLVTIWEDDSAYGFPQNRISPFVFLQWTPRNHVFDDAAALTESSVNLTGSGTPEFLHAHRVTTNFFSVLGVRPLTGRAFVAADGEPGHPLTVVLSHGLWVRRFGSDPRIIGQDVQLNDARSTVIGVMGPDFQFLDSRIDVWLPSQWTGDYVERRKTDHFLITLGRLKPGVGLGQARDDMSAVSRQLAADRVWDDAPVLVPLRDQVAGRIRPAILMLLCAVGLLLLITCANVASLQIAYGAARVREIALRLALGATRSRVIEQLLTEHLLLSLVGGACGVAVAVWSIHLLTVFVPRGIVAVPLVDSRVLTFTAAISIATGIAFGVLPALGASRPERVTHLKHGSGLRRSLVVAEIAMAVLLASTATLTLRSFALLSGQNPGFRPAHVLTLQTPLALPRYASEVRRREFYRDVIQRIESLPEVVAAGYVTSLPLANSGGGSLVTFEHHPIDPRHMMVANMRVVTPDYFRAIQMNLRRGRLIDGGDGTDRPKVALINETMARESWPNDDPLGRRFKRGSPETDSPYWTVVGIVADMRQGGMDVPIRPESYFSFEQADFYAPDSLAIRTTADPAAIAEAVRREVSAVDKDQPITAVRALQSLVDLSVEPALVQTRLLLSFSGVAMLLVSLGVYAVLSLAVTRRTREIAIRVAVGAARGDLLRMVVGEGLGMAAVGLSVGLATAVMLARVFTHLLFGVQPLDPLSYAAATLFLIGVVALASYLPARRAVRLNPSIALRSE